MVHGRHEYGLEPSYGTASGRKCQDCKTTYPYNGYDENEQMQTGQTGQPTWPLRRGIDAVRPSREYDYVFHDGQLIREAPTVMINYNVARGKKRPIIIVSSRRSRARGFEMNEAPADTTA